MLKAKVIIHDELVRQKLLQAAPRILEENREMVTQMGEYVKHEVEGGTPVGPAHFGYHGRDTVRLAVASHGVVTIGKISAAVQLYWREYGTRGRFRGPRGSELRSYTAAIGASGTGGERPRRLAHKALAGIRRYIKFYYGNAQWWRL